MRLSERQASISELLRENSVLNVDDLAVRFDVTTQTIRRDVNALCDFGLARRKRGRIESLATKGNIAYGSRQILNRGGKMLLAADAARHIPDNSSLSLGIGTTPEILASALLQHKNLRIFTNSLNIAQICCSNPTFEVHVAGGRVRLQDHDVLGPSTIAFFEAYKTDFGIFGVAGVDLEGGLLDFHEEEVSVRKAIRKNCRESILVLDHQKYGRSAHVKGGSIGDVDQVFCDKRPPEEICRILTASKTSLTISDGEMAE